MRAVVLEKKNGIAAVLKEDGTFATFKGNCEVGDEVEISDAPQFTLLSKGAVGTKVRRYGLAAAAALALFVGVGSYNYVYASPVTYVSMDVNPSVEFALNRRDEAISVEALNEDAEGIVDVYREREPGRIPVDEAVRMMTEILYEGEYLGTDAHNDVSLNVASDNEKTKERLSESTQRAIEEVKMAHKDTVPVHMSTATGEERDLARKEGVSAGEYIRRQMREDDADGLTAPPSDEDDGSRMMPPEESESRDGMPNAAGGQERPAPPDGAQEGNSSRDENAPVQDAPPPAQNDNRDFDGEMTPPQNDSINAPENGAPNEELDAAENESQAAGGLGDGSFPPPPEEMPGDGAGHGEDSFNGGSGDAPGGSMPPPR